ncbi:MAG: restriction endonuclease subunit S [Chlorobiaceae bacterium]|nr:restriction endonuclease subunit S [Chlorobiaceae bacterium]
MEVKKGYKQTEVGVIPEDWEVSTIGDLFTTSSGTTPARSLTDRYYHYGSIHWVKTLDLNNAGIFNTEELVTSKAIEETSLRVYPVGTVLVAMYGGFNQIGRTGILRVSAAVNQAITAIHAPQNKVIAEFLLAILNFKVSYWKTVASSSRKDPNITSKDIRDFPIALPPTKAEQESIAEALSDVDALIESLEQLIAKKRLIKRGVMQELLTGKKRLPGFSGEWEVKRLGDFGSTYGGLTNKEKSDFGKGSAYYVTFMNIMSNVVIDCDSFEKVIVTSGESQNRVIRGDLFFNGSSETPDEVGMCSFLSQDVQDLYLNSFCFGFRLRNIEEVNALFFAYYFRSSLGRQLIKSLAQGATRYNLSKTALLRVLFPIPSFEEQTAIAILLNDIDAEIAELERKLEKARKIKQGMMHNLLTGKIRLV